MSNNRTTSPIGVLRKRDFRLFFIGALLSNIGTWFQNIAAGLLIYEITGSTLLVATVNFAQFSGSVILAPWAGAAADRFDRRRLMIGTQVFAAGVGALLAVVTAIGWVTPWIIVGCALLLGLALAFMVPSLQALVPDLVGEEALATAVALNAITFNLARAVGPVLGAFVIQGFGYSPAFALNSASFAAFSLALFAIRTTTDRDPNSVRPRLRDSIVLVRSRPALLSMLVATVSISFATDPIMTLMPEMVIREFGGSEVHVGLLVSAFGGGATVIAVIFGQRLHGGKHLLLWSMMVQGWGMVMVGVSPHLSMALIGMALSGAGFIAGMTYSVTSIQTNISSGHRGRVMALWSIAYLGTRPIASLLDGVVAELTGARIATVVLASVVLFAAPYVYWRGEVSSE